MFGLGKVLEFTSNSFHKFIDKLDKLSEERAKESFASGIILKAELISDTKLSEEDVNEILFNVRNSSTYRTADELKKQQMEIYWLMAYKDYCDTLKNVGFMGDKVKMFSSHLNKI